MTEFWRWAWRWLLLFAFLSSVAFVFPHLVSPENLVFLGFLSNNDDNQLYLSFMREGAQGSWLTTIRFTPEAHQAALLLPIYQVLGKAARFLGLSNETRLPLDSARWGPGAAGRSVLVFHVVLACRKDPPECVPVDRFLVRVGLAAGHHARG